MAARRPPRRATRVGALSTLGALAALTALSACSLFTRGAPSPLRVASDIDNAPFAYLDENDRPAGRDVEMMVELARRLQRPIQWIRLPFEELLDAVEAGQADVVCATLGITPERAERVAFTEPYFETELSVIVRNGPREPTTLAELHGRRVYGGRGTTSERAIRGQLPDVVGVFEPEDDLTSEELLREKRVEGLVMDGPAARAMQARSWGTFRILKESLGQERYALVVAKDQEQLRQQLNQELKALKSSGRLSELDREYGL